MNVERTDAQWLCDHGEISVDELAELSGLSPEMLRELVDYGALVPVNAQSAQWRFTADCILAARTASRLREDFDLDTNALSLALTLIERIHGLEAQLRYLQTQLPRLRVKI